jgi:hypothetical protein
VDRSRIAKLSQRIEQVVQVRKPRAWLWAEHEEPNEQAVARYLAENPEHVGHDFMICRWGPPQPPGSPERPMGFPPIGTA